MRIFLSSDASGGRLSASPLFTTRAVRRLETTTGTELVRDRVNYFCLLHFRLGRKHDDEDLKQQMRPASPARTDARLYLYILSMSGVEEVWSSCLMLARRNMSQHHRWAVFPHFQVPRKLLNTRRIMLIDTKTD